MTPGLITIREKLHPQIRIKQEFVIVRTVHTGMAVNTSQCCPQPAVICPVAGRDAVALQAGSVPRLVEQTVIDRSVRFVTLGAASTFNEVIINDRMFIKIRAGLIGMAFLT